MLAVADSRREWYCRASSRQGTVALLSAPCLRELLQQPLNPWFISLLFSSVYSNFSQEILLFQSRSLGMFASIYGKDENLSFCSDARDCGQAEYMFDWRVSNLSILKDILFVEWPLFCRFMVKDIPFTGFVVCSDVGGVDASIILYACIHRDLLSVLRYPRSTAD